MADKGKLRGSMRCAVISRSGRPEFIGGLISCEAIPIGALSRRHTKWMLSMLMLADLAIDVLAGPTTSASGP